ncbi:ornithine cyclodeaminase family protein [Wukongibacter baidiensis]|uniref:ornithine cyclodeaminase family protein n=1 Tax=Wukongibacter baidiensis TaxID=1723361 RepID=UPI003D7F93C9
MFDFYLISNDRVKESLDMLSVISQVEKAYLLKSQNEALLFPVITHDWVVGKKDMDIKSGCFGGEVNVFGLKALTYMEDNDAFNLPRLSGTMMIFNSLNGQLLGLLDSRSITGLRTGAAGAIGSKYLARKDSETLLIIGSGNQAFYNLAGNLLVMDNLKKVLIYDPLNKESAEAFASGVRERLIEEIFNKYSSSENYESLIKKTDVKYEAVEDLRSAAEVADIIVTVTPARSPLLQKDWIKKGVHINCVGADMEGKQEIDENIFSDAKIVVDDMHQATSIGETEVPIKKGVISPEDIHSEIGNIILGEQPARTSEDEITVFDTTGLALQDLIVAKHLLDLAEKDNLPKYKL